MTTPIREFTDELDAIIEKEMSVDAFDLPLDLIENLNVEVICSTYIDDCSTEVDGLHFILRLVSSHDAQSAFCRITSGDGGVLISRTELTGNMKELLFKSDEGWTYF